MSGALIDDTSAGTGFASAGISGGAITGGAWLGTKLGALLMEDDIIPGAPASYQLCKEIYVFHPLGARLADEPIIIAQSQSREITIQDAPDMVKEEFARIWVDMGMDEYIFGLYSSARIYGISALAFGERLKNGSAIPTNEAVDLWTLPDKDIYLSVLDPLNISGTLQMNQDPTSPDFQKVGAVQSGGKTYHPSRTVVAINERPIYLEYTSSAYGFTGRSVYQRCLYPLKSFINTMRTDDMVARKAGVLIAKIRQPGSIVSGLMAMATGVKRWILKEAEVDNVISIDAGSSSNPPESIESLNLMNIDGAMTAARKNILENIAASAPLPAVMLNGETFAEGFGEGTEDAKKVANFIHRFRLSMQKGYAFCDRLVMHKAWSEDFYKTVQAGNPQYEGVDYKAAFYEWKNSFRAEWPSLLIEPDSKRSEGEDVKLKAIIAMLEVLLPEIDPDNKAETIRWAAENFNALTLLFTSPLVLDYDSLEAFIQDQQAKAEEMAAAGAQTGQEGGDKEPPEPPPESSHT